MALYITRPRRDEVRIGRGLPSASGPSLLKDRIGTEKGFKFCSPSLQMVTSPYKRTILERNKTNKQTKLIFQ